MNNKKYDIVVYGATGFTGQLVCEYLSSHDEIDKVNWAIAGRNIERLNLISEKYSNVDIIHASSDDPNSLDEMCVQAKLILTTVGPYDLYGEPLINSCINNKSHYVDLTGEPQFVHRMVDKYNNKAIEQNVAIVNCCGFESIPPDVGTYHSVKQLKSKSIEVNYFLQTRGTISGGTWASFLNSIISKQPIIKIRSTTKNKKKAKKLYYNKDLGKWAMIFPVIDKQIVMRSSKSSSQYGENFNFNEYMLSKSYMRLIVLLLGIISVSFLAKFKIFRNWLISLRPSGSGPNKEQRENNWFKATIIAKGNSKTITTIIKGKDPGYGETSKFISEMALCIILDYDKLNSSSGFLTPVQCSKGLLIERLRKAGISIASS